QAAPLERVAQVGDDRVRLELANGEVDADRERLLAREALVDDNALAARRVQDPAANRDDQARLLGERDELERRDVPAGRVPPAQERLDAGDLARLEPGDRLGVERELGRLDRALGLGAELGPLRSALGHRRL